MSAHNVVSLCARIPVSSGIIIYRNPFLCKFKVFETRNNLQSFVYIFIHICFCYEDNRYFKLSSANDVNLL